MEDRWQRFQRDTGIDLTQELDFTEYYTKSETDGLLSTKVDDAQLPDYYTKLEVDTIVDGIEGGGADLTNYYTKTATNALLDAKVDDTQLDNYYDKSTVDTTLADYYTSTQVDANLNNYYTKAAADALLGGKVDDAQLDNYYTKTVLDVSLADKVDNADLTSYYTKTATDGLLDDKVDNAELNNFYTKSSTDTLLAEKIEATALDNYYVKAEIDTEIDGKLDFTEIQFTPAAIAGTYGTRLTVPTHVTPAGGQSTHPSVLFFADGWNGYKYWMAHTPYPGSDDSHEDPNIVASHDGITWSIPAGLTNPLDDQPGSPAAYNSDVDLKMGPDDTMFLFWRTYDVNATGTEEKLYCRTSTNGTTWTAKVLVMSNAANVRRLLSPSFIFENNQWTMWAVDIVPSPNVVVRAVSNSANVDGGWGTPSTISIGSLRSGREPWHLFVNKFNKQYVGLITDVPVDVGGANGDMLFITSKDGLSFTNSNRSIIPRLQPGEHDNLYRATLIPSYQDGRLGYRIWYSAYINSDPDVWNIYRTWVSGSNTVGEKAKTYGTFNVNVAAAGFLSTPVTFPTNMFGTTPHINITAASGRCTLAIASPTAAGCSITVNNWTGAGSGTIPIYWEAVASGVDTGVVATPSIIAANGGFLSIAVSFPSNLFASAPHINITSGSGRANCAASSITTTGFNLDISNFTTSAISAGVNFLWQAVAK